MNGRFNVCKLSGDQMKTATDLALEFVKRRIPTSFRDEKEMRELCAAGKSSTYDAVIFGHAQGRREALAMAQGLVDALTELKRLKAEYLGNGGLFNPELMHLSGKELARVLNITPNALAKYEEWKDGK